MPQSACGQASRLSPGEGVWARPNGSTWGGGLRGAPGEFRGVFRGRFGGGRTVQMALKRRQWSGVSPQSNHLGYGHSAEGERVPPPRTPPRTRGRRPQGPPYP